MNSQVFGRIPSYRLHKASGSAVVTLHGRDHYLGRYGTEASRSEYRRLIAEWLSNGCAKPPGPPADDKPRGISVNEVIAGFYQHAKGYYRKDGQPTSEVNCIRAALRPVKDLYGRTPAANFGPLALKAVRQVMIDSGLARTTINTNISRIKHAFKWAVENELIPPSVHHGLQAVAGLRAGRSSAREPEPVKPVPEEHVKKTLLYLSPQVAAMVRLQMLTGMRSGEVTAMRMQDIDRSGPNWIYYPEHHKTEHHGFRRVVVLGPAAQEVLRPFLRPMPWAYLFDPSEAVKILRTKRCGKPRNPRRKKPMARCSEHSGKRRQGEHYTTDSYRKAIDRACTSAKVPHWHPHQLRHNFATVVRKHFGIEAARAALGHHSVDITEVYAEQDRSLVEQVASKIG